MSNLQASVALATTGSATIENTSSPLSCLVRYKIVDKDGNTLSDWSTFNFFTQDSISSIISGYTPIYTISSVESGGVGINVKWTVPAVLESSSLDVYFAWSYDNSTYTDFVYADTVTSNTYYIEIPTVSTIKAKKVKLAVQVPTNLKIINTNALIFQTPGVSTSPILDAGTI